MVAAIHFFGIAFTSGDILHDIHCTYFHQILRGFCFRITIWTRQYSKCLMSGILVREKTTSIQDSFS